MAMKEKGWFLYLLECEDGSIYTGITVNVKKRYAQHACGKGAKYTRARPPKKILGIAKYPDRSSASKAEFATKKLTAKEKRKFCLSMKKSRQKAPG